MSAADPRPRSTQGTSGPGDRLRIAFVPIGYSPSTGGVQLLTQRLAEGLADRHGHAVTVITTDALRSPASRDPGRTGRRRETIGSVGVRRFPVASRINRLLRILRRAQARIRPRPLPPRLQPGPLTAGPLSVRMLLAVWRTCRTSDVVIGISAPYLTLVGTGLAPRRGRAARVGVPLLHHSPTATHRPVVLRSLRRFDTTVALTAFEAAELHAMGVSDDAIEVVAPGCDVQDAPPTPSEARRALGLPDRPTIGYVGRFAAYKGIDTILDAAPTVLAARPDTTVLLAGAPTGWAAFDALERRAATAIGDRLVVRRDFPEADKAGLLAACDVILTPSREESFGLVNIESWAVGRPVVAGDIPAVRSVVDDGSDGVLIPVGDAAALARAVTRLLDDPALATRMGERGRRRALSEFSWESVLDRWDAIVRSAVSRRGR